MKKRAMSLVEVKDSVSSLRGQMINIRINKGRRKIVRCVGEVVDTYPCVFTVLVKGEGAVLSYSYNDVICGMVSLSKIN